MYTQVDMCCFCIKNYLRRPMHATVTCRLINKRQCAQVDLYCFCTKTLHRPMRAAVTSRLDRIQRYSIIGDHVDINFCQN